jgi:NAD(P)-dependent dehydrogenase (short-subunit alcohol dehydrogenase family)
MSGWSAADIPDQSGRIALVTGANSGIGLVAARELAGAGAAVKLACRDTAKGDVAAAAIRDGFPAAEVEVLEVDLADLGSVRELASGIGVERLDLLVNNAGVMASPRRETADGFELQLGTNHLGHFALTGLLLDKLKASPGARVVTVSSGAHRIGRINFDNLQGERRYMRWNAYGQSKLANLLFAFELNRRAEAAGLALRSMAAHPGYAATNLQSSGPGIGGGITAVLNKTVMAVSNRLIAQSSEMGALPTLYAATFPDLPGGSYIGPDGLLEQRGHPKPVGSSAAARDPKAARRLWEVSEELTGVEFGLPAAPAPN